MIGMGLIAGVMPAVGAMRLRITDALRRNSGAGVGRVLSDPAERKSKRRAMAD